MKLPAGAELQAHWREVGEWWAGESTREVIRYLDASGIRRESISELPIRYEPTTQPLPYTEDHREDWSLRVHKTRDEKMNLAYLSYLQASGVQAETRPMTRYRSADQPYVAVHVASGYAFGRGMMLPEEIAHYAAIGGLAGVVLADPYSLVGAVEFHRAATNVGIRPLIGASFQLENEGEIVLIAKNRAGYQNLSQLISACHLSEERHYPRLRWPTLEQYAQGMICLCGGNSGPMVRHLLRNEVDGFRRILRRLTSIFSDGLYLNCERSYLPWERVLNRKYREIAGSYALKCIAGGLVTHPRREFFPVQDIIASAHSLCTIQEVIGRKPTDEKTGKASEHRPTRELNAERFLRTSEEMNKLFEDNPQLVKATLELLECCSSEVLPGRTQLPALYPDPEHALREITFLHAYQRYSHLTPSLRKRLNYELERIQRLGFANHFLIAWDMCRWANDQEIVFSGRGSVVDSAVAYSLGVSRIDAHHHRLHFDRFLPEDGSKRPDIDIDFPAQKRDDVRRYVTGQYGRERVATVAAIGSYCTRGIIREVGKVMGLPNEVISYIAKRIHGGVSPDRLESALNAKPELRTSQIPKERLRWIFALAERMMDVPRNMRAHSSGVVISQERLDKVVPLMYSASLEDETQHLQVIQWDKRSAKHYFDKFDLLCLRGQDVLSGVQERIRIHNKDFNVSGISVADEATYATMRSGELIGIPQSASPAMRQAHIRLKTRNLEDASLVQAGIRPGVGGAVKLNEMIARRHGKQFSFSHPDLEEILGNTYGIIVFQEQVDLLLQKFAGYCSGEAEDIREAIHKRRREDFGQTLHDEVIRRVKERGYTLQVAQEVFDLVAGFKGYGFAQGHALAFAEISIRSIYCQQNYPAEYFASLLDAQPAGYYGPCTLVNEARNRGVQILPVDINRSDQRFKVEDAVTETSLRLAIPNGTIRIGLNQVSGISEALRDRIHQQRPFPSVFDFCLRAQPSRDELEQLILVGAFDDMVPNRRQLLWSIPAFLSHSRQYCTIGRLPLVAAEPSLAESCGDFNRIEKAIHERRILDLDVERHLVSYERVRIESKGGLPTSTARRLPHGRKAVVVGNPIRLRFPPTPSGKRVVFFDLEDEAGLLNVTCFDDVYQRDGHAIVCSPYVTVVGESQVRDDHVAFLAERVFPYRPEILKALEDDFLPRLPDGDLGWGRAALPIATADFIAG